LSLDGLSSAKYLEELIIYSSPKLTDISAIKSCIKLNLLGLISCSILEHVDVLSKLKSLEGLSFQSSLRLQSEKPFSKLRRLKYLRLPSHMKNYTNRMKKDLPDTEISG
jgi:hypothetical protein